MRKTNAWKQTDCVSAPSTLSMKNQQQMMAN